MKRTAKLLMALMSLSCIFSMSVFANGSQQPAAAAKKVKITVWGPLENYSEAEKKSWTFCVEEYRRRYPNVELTSLFSPAGTDYRQQYDKALMAGNAPTVTNLLPYVDVQTRAANSMIADITPFVNNFELKKQGKVNTAMDSALQYNGKWYGLMDYIYLAGTVYNKSSLIAGGGDPDNLPKTWDDFAKLGQKVTDMSVPRFGYLLLGMEWNAWPFTPWVWSAGGEMVIPNGDGTYRIGFAEEPGVDAAMMWHDMIWKYRMTQKDVLKAWNELRDDMHSGRGVFAFGRIDHYDSDAERKYGTPRSNFSIMPIPAKDKDHKQASIAGGNAWIFSPTATESELKAAWDFVMMFDYDEKFQLEKWAFENSIGGLTDRIPPRADLIEKKFSMATSWPKGRAEAVAAVSATARMEPSCPNWNNLKNTICPYLQKILLKETISRDEIKVLLTKAADEAYASYSQTFKKK